MWPLRTVGAGAAPGVGAAGFSCAAAPRGSAPTTDASANDRPAIARNWRRSIFFSGSPRDSRIAGGRILLRRRDAARLDGPTEILPAGGENRRNPFFGSRGRRRPPWGPRWRSETRGIACPAVGVRAYHP